MFMNQLLKTLTENQMSVIAGIVIAIIILGVLYFVFGQQDISSKRYAVIETDNGTVHMELFTNKAPITTQNFQQLVSQGFYNGLSFHRIVPGFVVQGGDPKGDGTGGADKTIKLEINPDLKHDKAGMVAMARSADPNSASSQFYITLAAQPSLDGNYAVFGEVLKGMDVVRKIEKGDTMNRVYLTKDKPQTNDESNE